VIPAFDENGYLPAGVHRATVDEVLDRFGRGSEERIAQGQSLQWLLPMCRRADIERVILDGSFVTDIDEPNDVDCILVPGGAYDPDSDAALALRIGLPYLSIQVAESRADLEFYLYNLFASDRTGVPKGLVEVVL
jgi:hypothetical protein